MQQPTLEPLRRWDPERIGSYVLLGRLGAGAMGRVYLGRSTAGRLVAVKTIKIELADEAGFRARFAHEVAAARRVSGVFTAAVVAADPEADMPWLATAYVPAPSLSRLVAECGPLPVPAARWLAAGCAEALESIHSAGLVHRDLKPSNVLVSPDGPRVIDFGVARAAERIQLTVTRGAVGTPAYMAPEQARDTRQATVASDVFSLGATLAFAATGHAPYQGETVMDVLVRLATEPPDLVGLPAELDGIVTACLARSPAQRPTSAALLDQLGPFVAGPAGPGSARAYLPAPAMAVISGYQHGPRQATGASATAGDGSGGDLGGSTGSGSTGEGTGGEDTLGSQVALPAPPAASLRPLNGGGQRPGPAEGRAGAATPQRARGRRGHQTLVTAGLAGAAVALVGGGIIVGVSLPDRPGAARPGSTVPGFPPPGPPPSSFPAAPSGSPEIRMLQPMGDPDTVFLIHGTGWVPLSRITVTLAGHGASPVRPVVDLEGTFNYAVNQQHEFFRQRIPPGVYHVVVTGPGGRRARARFLVTAPSPGQVPPPAGQAAGAVRAPGSTTGPPAANTRPDRSAGPGRR
ncbi:MAG TPA: serine/threonine-protein kinase, partial [Streptosporangiaceae bacterium]|nr:serine/threonine-protein kinase [Streptosporangiaceae bacterium]